MKIFPTVNVYSFILVNELLTFTHKPEAKPEALSAAKTAHLKEKQQHLNPCENPSSCYDVQELHRPLWQFRDDQGVTGVLLGCYQGACTTAASKPGLLHDSGFLYTTISIPFTLSLQA